jgi:hypothetical protein
MTLESLVVAKVRASRAGIGAAAGGYLRVSTLVAAGPWGRLLLGT